MRKRVPPPRQGHGCLLSRHLCPHLSAVCLPVISVYYCEHNMKEYVCMYGYVCMHVCMYVPINVCMYVYTYVCYCMYVWYVCIYVLMYVCTYINTYIHRCIHTRIHSCMHKCPHMAHVYFDSKQSAHTAGTLLATSPLVA